MEPATGGDIRPADVAMPPAPGTKPAWVSFLRSVENGALVAVLAAMVLLPVSEVLRRMGLPGGIAGADDWLRHLTLIAGMLGGMIAARENRLLALSSLPTFLKGTWKRRTAAFSGVIATAITLFLCAASWQFVLSERTSGTMLAHGVPTWVVQAVLPLAFGAIAVRLAKSAASTWKGWLGVAAAVALIAWLATKPPLASSVLTGPCLGVLVVATVFGAPIFVTLGGTALILFWGRSAPLASIPLDHYEQVTNALLPTVPLFTLAGYFLAESGASKRLVRVFNGLVGHIRGGPAIVTALACAFFTTFTGGSGVTILALGGLLMPVLLASGYSERSSLGLLTGAGSLGILFPPCLPLILYAIVAQITIKDIFLGGLLPGVLLVALTVWWGVRSGPALSKAHKFDGRELGRAAWEAKWELALPLVAMGALFGGFALPVEAAALTASYAFLVETVVHRDLQFRTDVPRVIVECGLLVGGVLLILGVAMGLTNFLITEQVPDRAVTWVTAAIHSKWVFLFFLNLFLLVVGCLMDIFSAIIVVVPLMVPMGVAFGIDPVHLGIVFLANLELGYLTPPVGMNLFLASYRFNKPMSEVIRSVLPMLAVLLIGVLVITYLPFLTTWLPHRFK